MPDLPPRTIPINHDDYHAAHVGHLADGRQVFATTSFVTLTDDSDAREYLAVYTFDRKGAFLQASIDDLGLRSALDENKARTLLQTRLSGLGTLYHGRIEIEPFEIERFGQTFGLILQEPEDEDDDYRASVEPGDYMAFFPPWDGDYDT